MAGEDPPRVLCTTAGDDRPHGLCTAAGDDPPRVLCKPPANRCLRCTASDAPCDAGSPLRPPTASAAAVGIAELCFRAVHRLRLLAGTRGHLRLIASLLGFRLCLRRQLLRCSHFSAAIFDAVAASSLDLHCSFFAVASPVRPLRGRAASALDLHLCSLQLLSYASSFETLLRIDPECRRFLPVLNCLWTIYQSYEGVSRVSSVHKVLKLLHGVRVQKQVF